MRHAVGRARDAQRPVHRLLLHHGDAPQRFFVIGDQKIFTKEKIELAGGEATVLAVVIHRVDDHEQVRCE